MNWKCKSHELKRDGAIMGSRKADVEKRAPSRDLLIREGETDTRKKISLWDSPDWMTQWAASNVLSLESPFSRYIPPKDASLFPVVSSVKVHLRPSFFVPKLSQGNKLLWPMKMKRKSYLFSPSACMKEFFAESDINSVEHRLSKNHKVVSRSPGNCFIAKLHSFINSQRMTFLTVQFIWLPAHVCTNRLTTFEWYSCRTKIKYLKSQPANLASEWDTNERNKITRFVTLAFLIPLFRFRELF